MPKKLIQVEGNPNLVRDKNTGAILNINKKKTEEAKAAKERRQQLAKRVDKLEYQMDTIISLLTEIKNKNG